MNAVQPRPALSPCLRHFPALHTRVGGSYGICTEGSGNSFLIIYTHFKESTYRDSNSSCPTVAQGVAQTREFASPGVLPGSRGGIYRGGTAWTVFPRASCGSQHGAPRHKSGLLWVLASAIYASWRPLARVSYWGGATRRESGLLLLKSLFAHPIEPN